MKTAADDLTMLCAKAQGEDALAACYQRILLPLGMLLRWRLSLAAAGAVLLGMVVQQPSFDFFLGLAALGGFLGCAGCSALNQLQERRLDALMTRTQTRPLVVGAFKTPVVVKLISLCFLLSGAFFYLAGNWPAVGTLLVIIFLYNGLYTFLKGRTTFFLIPGAVAGALLPMLGWLCSGGELGDFKCLALGAVFFVWQIPHFWLLTERHRTEYAEVGIQFPWRYFSDHAGKIQFFWIGAFALMLLALPGFGIIQSSAGQASVAGITFLLLLAAFKPRRVKQALFHFLNGAMLLALLILLFERILYSMGS